MPSLILMLNCEAVFVNIRRVRRPIVIEMIETGAEAPDSRLYSKSLSMWNRRGARRLHPAPELDAEVSVRHRCGADTGLHPLKGRSPRSPGTTRIGSPTERSRCRRRSSAPMSSSLWQPQTAARKVEPGRAVPHVHRCGPLTAGFCTIFGCPFAQLHPRPKSTAAPCRPRSTATQVRDRGFVGGSARWRTLSCRQRGRGNEVTGLAFFMSTTAARGGHGVSTTGVSGRPCSNQLLRLSTSS